MRAWSIFALACAVELAAWAVARDTADATFSWLRVSRHAGLSGLAGAVLAGALAAVLSGRLPARWGLGALASCALIVHALFLHTPQIQPDTINYFVQAQLFAQAPLDTLLSWPDAVWHGSQGRFHRLMPLVPLLYGQLFRVLGESPAVVDIALTGVAVALPLAVAAVGSAAGQPRVGLVAGWLSLGVPYVLAQSGWMLVDLPLAVLLCLTLAAGLRVRGADRWLALAILGALACLSTKVSAGLFLLAPLAALVLWRFRMARILYVLGAGGTFALFLLHPPHLRDPTRYLDTALALGLHLRPSLWVLALSVLPLRSRLDAVVASTMLVVPALIVYGPAEHIARYALPLVALLALGAAARLPRGGAAALVVSGLVIAVLGYRPVLVHNQAANVPAAVRALEDRGVGRIEVWSSAPATTFPASALTALVDFYATVPVCVGGDLLLARPGAKRRWWEHYEPPPHHRCDSDADGVLLGLAGTDARAFERQTGLEPVERISLYKGSHWLFPREIVLYYRNSALR